MVLSQISTNPGKSLAECALGVAWVVSFCMKITLAKRHLNAFVFLSKTVDLILRRDDLPLHIVAATRWPVYSEMSKVGKFKLETDFDVQQLLRQFSNGPIDFD